MARLEIGIADVDVDFRVPSNLAQNTERLEVVGGLLAWPTLPICLSVVLLRLSAVMLVCR